MNRKIGLFDSGLGGLSILKEMMNTLPNEDYLFYEDSINNPYGNKTEEELFEITSKIVDYLLKEDCKIIVIACNTATTSCMNKLREKYPDTIFVGTVPAIKLAFDNDYKRIINLSTPFTRNSKRVIELINDNYKPGAIIYNISGINLANLVELNKKEEIDRLLTMLLSPYKESVDAVVLGCTHYSLIKPEIQKVLPKAALLDGTKGVTKEVQRQLKEHNLLSNKTTKGTLEIINTKDDSLVKRSYEILK